ncbi:MAG: GlcG/HbpS family heme-binding protein [Burkholderiales bacterium]
MQSLTLELAANYLERAMSKARQEFGRPICVAICDPSGFLIAFARMEGAPLRSIQISQSKAYTAVRMGVSTDALLARLKKEGIEIGYFCDPLMTALPGGNLLKDAAGVLLGAIGISGLAATEDQVITEYVAELAKAT